MPNVLIIDDDPIFLEQMKKFLELKEMDVVIASDGKTGLDSFKKNKIDAVFLDLNLPDIDGIQVFKKIKKMNTDIPICVITGLSGIDLTQYYKKLMDEHVIKDFLCKPVDPSEMERLVLKYTK